MPQLNQQATRRGFIKKTTAAGIGFWVAGGLARAQSNSPNEQLQIAKFGVGGKGRSDLRHTSNHGKIIALCDTDRSFLEAAAATDRYKTDHTYTDFRELFDKVGDQVDVAVVSTPDHTHAVIAAQAMKNGMHCYCQKPLTHTIWEARQLGEIARKNNVVTQMGNQFTSLNAMREAAYRIRAGQLGTVSDVYAWTNRPVWPQGKKRPDPSPVPETLDWESWIGPAPMRPYAEASYHDFNWRGWWDFGTGSLGDMACHTWNLPYMALTMRDPTSVTAESSPNNHDSYPDSSKIDYDFPELDGRAAFKLHWSDNSQLPPKEIYAKFLEGKKNEDGSPRQLSASGCIIVGDKASLYAAGDYAQDGIELDRDMEWLDVDYPKPMEITEGDQDPVHVAEFYNGIHHPDQPPVSNFPNYAGPMVESILLGNLALWKGGRVEWDAKTLTPSDPSLKKIVRVDYREGYEV